MLLAILGLYLWVGFLLWVACLSPSSGEGLSSRFIIFWVYYILRLVVTGALPPSD